MTTVAYRDGKMAGDSGDTRGNLITPSAVKVFEVEGHLIGLAGTASIAASLVNFIRENGAAYFPKPERIQSENDGVWALVVTPDRKVYRYDGYGHPIEVLGEFHALGSGSDLALAAMEMGATASRAVEIACKYDTSTCGPVRVVCQ